MISDFKIGDKVKACLLVRVIKAGETSKGGVFARGTVQDKDKTMNFISFKEEVVTYLGAIGTKSLPLLVEGDIALDTYAKDGSFQLKLESIDNVPEGTDLTHLLQEAPYDTEAYWDKFMEMTQNINDKSLRNLWERLFSIDGLFEQFCKTPGGKKMHHAYIGGLLKHSVDVAEKSLLMASLYPKVNKDLVVTGALLHDVGKYKEISSNLGFDYTDEGSLLGHIGMGAIILQNEIDKISDFPQKLKQELVHIIMSHHGKKENGSPIEPATQEAMIVHFCDDMDAHLENFENQPGGWQYSNMLKRNIWVVE